MPTTEDKLKAEIKELFSGTSMSPEILKTNGYAIDGYGGIVFAPEYDLPITVPELNKLYSLSDFSMSQQADIKQYYIDETDVKEIDDLVVEQRDGFLYRIDSNREYSHAPTKEMAMKLLIQEAKEDLEYD